MRQRSEILETMLAFSLRTTHRDGRDEHQVFHLEGTCHSPLSVLASDLQGSKPRGQVVRNTPDQVPKSCILLESMSVVSFNPDEEGRLSVFVDDTVVWRLGVVFCCFEVLENPPSRLHVEVRMRIVQSQSCLVSIRQSINQKRILAMRTSSILGGLCVTTGMELLWCSNRCFQSSCVESSVLRTIWK